MKFTTNTASYNPAINLYNKLSQLPCGILHKVSQQRQKLTDTSMAMAYMPSKFSSLFQSSGLQIWLKKWNRNASQNVEINWWDNFEFIVSSYRNRKIIQGHLFAEDSKGFKCNKIFKTYHFIKVIKEKESFVTAPFQFLLKQQSAVNVRARTPLINDVHQCAQVFIF